MALEKSITELLKRKLNRCLSENEISELVTEMSEQVRSHIQVMCPDSELLCWIPISEILYIDRDMRSSLVFTKNQKVYELPLSYEMIQRVLSDFNFETTDNKIQVNLDNVYLYDGKKGRIYFSPEMSEKSKFHYTYLSTRRVKFLRDKLGKDKDISSKTYKISKELVRNLPFNVFF